MNFVYISATTRVGLLREILPVCWVWQSRIKNDTMPCWISHSRIPLPLDLFCLCKPVQLVPPDPFSTFSTLLLPWRVTIFNIRGFPSSQAFNWIWPRKTTHKKWEGEKWIRKCFLPGSWLRILGLLFLNSQRNLTDIYVLCWFANYLFIFPRFIEA